jgi:hypothetical protein
MQDDVQERITVKQLRKELAAWGRYWASKEYGQGHASRSACDKLGEVRCFGAVFSESSSPAHIAEYDRRIARLSHECRRALRVHYICERNWALVEFDSEKSYIYWLKRAERELL